MKSFRRAREAKELLASKIIEEAHRENVALSEVERKMLYFSETGWTLPDMGDVYDEFDSEYDQDEYEGKIARLVKGAYRHTREEPRDEYDAWWAAIRLLSRQDHYIRVLIGNAGLRPRGDQLKLLGAGVAIVTLMLTAEFGFVSLSRKNGTDLGRHLPVETLIVLCLAAAAGWFLIRDLVVRFIADVRRLGFPKLITKLVRSSLRGNPK